MGELVRLTLKNYRCFSDTSPASIDIGDGFTALVGPNNSGKSSFLRMIYELRHTFSRLDATGNFLNLLKGGKEQTGGPIGVQDPLEIFCDSNARGLSVEMKAHLPSYQGGSPARLVTATLSLARNDPNHWSGTFHADPAVNLKNTQPNRFVGDELQIQGLGPLDCAALFRTGRALSQALYIGPFRNALNEGAGTYYDLTVGTGFVNLWNTWKTGPSKSHNRAIERITEDIRRIFGFRRLEIAAAEGMKTLHVNVDGKPYKLGELGAGLAQFIIVFGNAAVRKPPYILIDEPELSLHPSLQTDFLTSLASYADIGIVFATHSLGLARSCADRIYSLRNSDSGALCRPFEQTPNYAEFLGEMSFSSFKELGCESVLLVEGATDVRTIQQFLRLLDKDHKVVVLPLGGDQLARGGMELELSELTRITPKVYALVDSECEKEGSPPSKSRVAFAESCKSLNMKFCLTALRAIENYLTDRAIKEELGPRYKALKPFERLSDSPMGWAKRDNWRIARHMTKDELVGTDIGTFLQSI